MTEPDKPPPDRVDRIVKAFRNHPVFAPLIVSFMALAAVAALWKPVMGESVRESLARVWPTDPAAAYADKQDCLDQANGNWEKMQRCQDLFP